MKNQFITKLFRRFNFFAIAFSLCVLTPGFAMDVTLRWDANTETDRAGYRIYYDTASGPPYEGIGAAEGASFIDVKITDVESGGTAQYEVTGLDDDEVYFFALTAYNTRGGESGYSNEVSTGDGTGTGNEGASDGGGGGCFILTVKP